MWNGYMKTRNVGLLSCAQDILRKKFEIFNDLSFGGDIMARSIFRKVSLDRVSNPEQLNDYIRVTNPGVWMILSAVILLLAGVCVWSIFGRLDTTITVGAVTENNQTVCYVKEAEIQKLESGMQVWIGEKAYQIDKISQQPIRVDDTFAEYLLHVGDLSEGEWVYIAELDDIHDENGMIVEAEIVIESIAPMSFVLN